MQNRRFYLVFSMLLVLATGNAQNIPLEFGQKCKDAEFAKNNPPLEGLIHLRQEPDGGQILLFYSALRHRQDSMMVTTVRTDDALVERSRFNQKVKFTPLIQLPDLRKYAQNLFFPRDSFLQILHISEGLNATGSSIAVHQMPGERLIAFFEQQGRMYRFSRNIEDSTLIFLPMGVQNGAPIVFRNLPAGLFKKSLRFANPTENSETDGEYACRNAKFWVESDRIILLLDEATAADEPAPQSKIIYFDLINQKSTVMEVPNPSGFAEVPGKKQIASSQADGKLFQVFLNANAYIIRISDAGNFNAIWEKRISRRDSLDFLSTPLLIPGETYFEFEKTALEGENLIKNLPNFDLFIEPRMENGNWILALGGYLPQNRKLMDLLRPTIQKYDAFGFPPNIAGRVGASPVALMLKGNDKNKKINKTGIWANVNKTSRFYVVLDGKLKTVIKKPYPRTLIDRCGKMLAIAASEEKIYQETVFKTTTGYYLGRLSAGQNSYIFKKVKDF